MASDNPEGRRDGERSPSCYKTELDALRADRDALLKAAKDARATIQSDGWGKIPTLAILEFAIKGR